MMALEDPALASAIVEAALLLDASLALYTLAGSATHHAANKQGMRVVPEFFADRGYHRDGRVKMFDWRIEEAGGTPIAIAERVVRLVQHGLVESFEGDTVTVTAKTVCVHSDTPDAPAIAAAIRQALQDAGIAIDPPLTA